MPIIFDNPISPGGAVVFDAPVSAPGILSAKSNGTANLMIEGEPLTLTVNQLPVAQGQVEVQSADGLYQSILTITTWDSATGSVVATGARGELPFGKTDAILIVEASDGSEFDRVTGITVQAPDSLYAWVNGNTPSIADNSVFKNAVAAPTGEYQLLIRDPSNLNPVVLSNGEVDQADGEGDILVRAWDALDGTTSDEVAFTVENVLAVHPAVVRVQGNATLTAIGRAIARPVGSVLAHARAFISKVRLNAAGRAPAHRTLTASDSHRPEMGIMTFYKQPAEQLDYDIDLTAWLHALVDNIQSVEVEVSDPDLEITSYYIIGGTRLKIWIRAGTERRAYGVSARFTTQAGRIEEFDFRIAVRHLS